MDADEARFFYDDALANNWSVSDIKQKIGLEAWAEICKDICANCGGLRGACHWNGRCGQSLSKKMFKLKEDPFILTCKKIIRRTNESLATTLRDRIDRQS
jgi:hypothetical protein